MTRHDPIVPIRRLAIIYVSYLLLCVRRRACVLLAERLESTLFWQGLRQALSAVRFQAPKCTRSYIAEMVFPIKARQIPMPETV
jgi:hypothetical protein